MSNDPTAELWAQAIDEHIAGLSDTDFGALVARTRPKPISQMSHRELQEQIARKSAVSRKKPGLAPTAVARISRISNPRKDCEQCPQRQNPLRRMR